MAFALLVLARPVKQRLFPNRKDARHVMLVLAQDASLAELPSEVDATGAHLDRIVVRPSTTDDEDVAELVLVKGTQERDVLSLTDKLRRVSGVREVNSVLDGSIQSKN